VGAEESRLSISVVRPETFAPTLSDEPSVIGLLLVMGSGIFEPKQMLVFGKISREDFA
jgi:hypothetical protein